MFKPDVPLQFHLRTITLFVFLILSLNAIAQTGYILSDSSGNFGLTIRLGPDKLNSKYCEVQTKDGITKYYPDQVVEYGIIDGPGYVSKEIPFYGGTRKVFMERLIRGNIGLFYYKDAGKKRFFIERDSGRLEELVLTSESGERNAYKNQLHEITGDCPEMSEVVELVRYSENSLSVFFTHYNSCDAGAFPYPRFGVTAGYKFFKPGPNPGMETYIGSMKTHFTGSPFAGIFADLPLRFKNLSVLSALEFSRQSYSYYNYSGDMDNIDFIGSMNALDLTLLFRYRFPCPRVNLFINAGVMGVFNLSSTGLTYYTHIENNVVEFVDILENSFLSDYYAGIAAGLGAEYRLYNRKSISIEIRYGYMPDISDSPGFVPSVISIHTGFSF